MLVVLLFAGVVYALMWALERRRAGGSPAPTLPRRRPTPPRQVAPDDDEDFLRDLERKRRHTKDDTPDT